MDSVHYSGGLIIMLLLLITRTGKPKYALENGKYIITGHDLERVYDPRFITLFPRMWSDQSDHQEVYQEWGRVKGTPIQVTDQNGRKEGYQKTNFQ